MFKLKLKTNDFIDSILKEFYLRKIKLSYFKENSFLKNALLIFIETHETPFLGSI